MSWTDERVEQLKALWSAGNSASQIAKELGGVTRNAVIGKIHRLGLSNRSQTPDKEEPSAGKKKVTSSKGGAQSAGKTPKSESGTNATKSSQSQAESFEQASNMDELDSVEITIDFAALEAQALRLTLLELTERTCKWPIGDPNDADFHFCGLACDTSKPYCEGHSQAAYQPMSSRRDRERSRAVARLASG